MTRRTFTTALATSVPIPTATRRDVGNVKIHAAAVARIPLTAIATEYERATGIAVTLLFDTAGAAEKRFLADVEAAVLMTNIQLIRNAEGAGILRDGTSILLGSTFAGIAVMPGSTKPDVSTPEKLKATLLAANCIAVSDPTRGATVGTHFMKVIAALGVTSEILPKVKFSRDGVETLRLVIDGIADLGVSQSSEIIQANRDALVGPFPHEFALTTAFAVWHRNDISSTAAELVTRLTNPQAREKFATDGIVPP